MASQAEELVIDVLWSYVKILTIIEISIDDVAWVMNLAGWVENILTMSYLQAVPPCVAYKGISIDPRYLDVVKGTASWR